MCLYPRLIKNPKFKRNKKNGGVIPRCTDERTKHVPIGCQVCIECRNQKAREWQCRIQEDIKHHKDAKFVTLTFSTAGLKKIIQDDRNSKATLLRKIKRLLKSQNEKDHEKALKLNSRIKPLLQNLKGYDLDNAICTRAVRYFLERWRKKYGKSPRHWLITELGGGHSEHVHLHGIIWMTSEQSDNLENIWSYGTIWKGYKTINELTGKVELENYVNEKTVNYITKYVTKIDEKHISYKPIILCSAGIGMEYIIKGNGYTNRWQGKNTKEYYRTTSGHKISLPIYWRNKLWTEEQRNQLWIKRLDENVRYVCGEKISVEKSYESYYNILEFHRGRTKKLGYSTPRFIWSKAKYEEERREMIHKDRLEIQRGNNNNNKIINSVPENN